MATTLPAATDYTGAAVTQGGKKTFITSVRSFIADLFGTDSTLSAAHVAFRNAGADTLLNCSIAASVATSALTIALKGIDGNDPSATNPVLVGMRSSTATSGAANLRSATAAASIVVPSTATLGQSNGTRARLWVALIDNAGTLELAVMNALTATGTVQAINESAVISTTALSTGSDGVGIWYSTSARSNVPFRVIGYIENTQATAGTWATSPSAIQPMVPGLALPGEVLQEVILTDAGSSTSASSLTNVTGSTKTITPRSSVSSLLIDTSFQATVTAGGAATNTVGAWRLYNNTGTADIGQEYTAGVSSGSGANLQFEGPGVVRALVANTASTAIAFLLRARYSGATSATVSATSQVWTIREIQA